MNEFNGLFRAFSPPSFHELAARRVSTTDDRSAALATTPVAVCASVRVPYAGEFVFFECNAMNYTHFPGGG